MKAPAIKAIIKRGAQFGERRKPRTIHVQAKNKDALEATIVRGDQDITLFDAAGNAIAIFEGYERITLTSLPGCPDPSAHDA